MDIMCCLCSVQCYLCMFQLQLGPLHCFGVACAVFSFTFACSSLSGGRALQCFGFACAVFIFTFAFSSLGGGAWFCNIPLLKVMLHVCLWSTHVLCSFVSSTILCYQFGFSIIQGVQFCIRHLLLSTQ